MGFITATASCLGCGQTFTFNPMSVPSIIVKGSREPICRDCITRANLSRLNKGLPAIPILPDAYEPVDERDMVW